ncbi:exodeoxyribonuclease V subunit alpha [Alteromonas pelagimontana]|uniref:RecBCD enzyme subunit RecD n=1 Tax=Alteromonas pelagimontana TaxID=1858656 RepID=A0A6M4MHD6_9ALTE|nr:exodeoxyribonuclease V subunit alpha [Alteromonas pelagimontana]QJR82338.1 exodeoxyribonuclease V subunit alpha [Alteromonas pelagimontana]
MSRESFTAATKRLAGLEAIDFYFARLMTELFDATPETADDWFHILLALSYAQRQGNTCLNLSAIANQTWFAQPDDDKAGYRFPDYDRLHALTQFCLQGDADGCLVYWQGRLYSQRYWQFETDVAETIAARLAVEPLDDGQYSRLAALWPEIFDVDPQSQQNWQQIATASSLSQRFTIINGGPGTGKTYTVTRLMLALQAAYENKLHIQLAAPTGKAAQRLSESVSASLHAIAGEKTAALKPYIPNEAVTLHRLLGLQRFGVQTRKNAVSPLTCDVLIVDEASMVDLALMARLCRALPANAQLVLVGDAEQLPAVESGNVLEALLAEHSSGSVTPAMAAHIKRLCPHLPALPVSETSRSYVQTLQVSHRFAGNIALVATAIKNSDAEFAWRNIKQIDTVQGFNLLENQEVRQLPSQDLSQQLRTLARKSFSNIVKSQSLEEAMTAVNYCRWLSPVRKGPLGVEQLNQQIESALGLGGALNGRTYYRGRPVMVLENQYSQGLFNGDVGLIWPDDEGNLKAWFEKAEGGYRGLSISRLPRVETVFAMTVHKSQGSEFAQVVLFIPDATGSQMDSVCTRELLYTGLTRARQGALLVSSQSRFADVVATRQQRFSGLAQAIVTKLGGNS